MIQQNKELSYAVIGVGGVGGFYGGKLANAGKEVHFLFHSNYLYVSQNGLKVDSVSGNFHLIKPNAYCNTQSMPQVDVVLVALKTTQNHLLPKLIEPLLHANTAVVFIQNGLGMEEALSKHFPSLNIIGAIAFISAFKQGEGSIKHIDNGQIELGEYQLNNKSLLSRISDDFTQAGVASKLIDNLAQARWKKLVWNIAFNGPSVVMNATTKQLLGNKSLHTMVSNLMHEVVEAANACDVELKPELVTKMIEVTSSMADYSPSMKLDYQHNRPLEIEAIYTSPIATASKVGFNMKLTRQIEQQLLFIDEQQRKRN